MAANAAASSSGFVTALRGMQRRALRAAKRMETARLHALHADRRLLVSSSGQLAGMCLFTVGAVRCGSTGSKRRMLGRHAAVLRQCGMHVQPGAS
eukprot:775003-Prymnesium_polylepis.1